jgi:hypothetical protein
LRGKLIRRPLKEQLATLWPGSRAKLNEVITTCHEFNPVIAKNHGVPFLHQRIQTVDQHLQINPMQTKRGFINEKH